MAGKPVVHVVDAGNDVVTESACGLSVAPENPQAMASAIREIAELPSREQQAMGQRGREYVLAHHNCSVLAQRFLEVMRGGGGLLLWVRASAAPLWRKTAHAR